MPADRGTTALVAARLRAGAVLAASITQCWQHCLQPTRFKPAGRPVRRPRATNGGLMLRGDEESACAHKLDDSQLPRKAPVELTAVVSG
jgi:hypothetical protein